MDLLCAARTAAERPATSSTFDTPQVSAAVDAPQQEDCSAIRVIVARGVTIGRGSTTDGAGRNSASIESEKVLVRTSEEVESADNRFIKGYFHAAFEYTRFQSSTI